jgi:hypothetical protein
MLENKKDATSDVYSDLLKPHEIKSITYKDLIGELLCGREDRYGQVDKYGDRKVIGGLLSEILVPMGRTKVAELNKLSDFLYFQATRMIEAENYLALETKIPAAVRGPAASNRRALIQVSHSLTRLKRAKSILREELPQLKKGFLDFDHPQKTLELLENRLLELNADLAALVHPTLRKDEQLPEAERSRRKFRHEYSLRKNSAQLPAEIAGLLEQRLKQFTRGRVPDINIDRFIAQFFHALGNHIDAGTIKTWRARRKPAKAKSSAVKSRRSS